MSSAACPSSAVVDVPVARAAATGSRACRRCRRRSECVRWRGARRRRPAADPSRVLPRQAPRAATAPPRRRTARCRWSPSAARPSSSTRSGGRCALPVGMRDHESRAFADAAARRRIVPPCSRTSSWVSARPMPVPSWVRDFCALDAVEALEHARQLVLGNADARVLDRQLDAAVASAQRRRGSTPSNVNLNALESRFRTIFSHMSRSTKTGSSIGAQSTSKRKPGVLDRRPERAGQLARQRAVSRSADRSPARGRPRCARSRAAR